MDGILGTHRSQEPAGVPIAEVSRFTGHSTRALMDFVRAGVLEQVAGRRACQLTSTSLRAWTAERGEVLPLVTWGP